MFEKGDVGDSDFDFGFCWEIFKVGGEYFFGILFE